MCPRIPSLFQAHRKWGSCESERYSKKGTFYFHVRAFPADPTISEPVTGYRIPNPTYWYLFSRGIEENVGQKERRGKRFVLCLETFLHIKRRIISIHLKIYLNLKSV